MFFMYKPKFFLLGDEEQTKRETNQVKKSKNTIRSGIRGRYSGKPYVR